MAAEALTDGYATLVTGANGLPKVSVIIPTYNRSRLLLETLNSVRNQTYSEWEAIVVDDGSTDETLELMSSLSAQDPRIRLLKRDGIVSGAPACRNQGLQASTGEYVTFLDSDDCLAPSCLEERIAEMRRCPELDFAVFRCQLFRRQPGDTAFLHEGRSQENDLDRFLALDVPWQTAGPVWRRKALERQGPWDESLPSWQDWEFHLRAFIKGLRYQQFSNGDCFWRLPDRDSIGLKALTPEHLRSHERLLAKVVDLLQEAQLLNSTRRHAVAGLYFWLVDHWLLCGSKGEAFRVWRVCSKAGLISKVNYYEGLVYISVSSNTLVRRCVKLALFARWPKKLVHKGSNAVYSLKYGAEVSWRPEGFPWAKFLIRLGVLCA